MKKMKKKLITANSYLTDKLGVTQSDWIIKTIQDSSFNQGMNYEPEFNQYRASGVGYCSRKLEYDKIAGHEKEEFDLETLGTFSIGNAVHEWIQKLFPEKYLVKAEQTVHYDYKDIQIKGHVDLLLLTSTGLHVSDIKTTSSKAFKWLDTYGAGEHHLAQANTYASIMGTKTYSIIYVRKEDFAMKCFEFDTNKDAFQSILDKMQLIHTSILNKVLLDKVAGKDEWQCNYCSYQKICDKVVLDDLPFYQGWEKPNDINIVVKNS